MRFVVIPIVVVARYNSRLVWGDNARRNGTGFPAMAHINIEGKIYNNEYKKPKLSLNI